MISTLNNNIFIAHGHDSNDLNSLRNFINHLKLKAIVLKDEDSEGKTIIEKFEKYASTATFAIVMLTPDDLQAEDMKGENKWRSRQNVILELGWFMAKLGRKRVLLLHKGDVEIPSDISGVLYLKYEKNIFEVTKNIKQRLSNVGYAIE